MIQTNPYQMSIPALAYLGDAVIELLVRDEAVKRGFTKSADLNNIARGFVTAVAQSAALEKIIGCLSEEESDIFRRGRNSNHLNIPKSASISEYRRATGFECVFGYLHLCGRTDRINELFRLGYSDKISG